MITILRWKYNDKITLGTLKFIQGEKTLYQCYSLELPWNDNKKNISCIPECEDYEVELYNSEKFGKCLKIKEVKDRTDILLHVGNYINFFETIKEVNKVDGAVCKIVEKTESQGCILVGDQIGTMQEQYYLRESKKAMNKLVELVEKFGKQKLSILYDF